MKKVKSLITVAMFLVSLVVISSVSAADIHVYSGQSIQSAINAANPGDTIYVHAGTYNENLTINKNLTLIGDGASVTTINDNSGGTLDVIEVNGAFTVNISGFTITNGNNGICYKNGASGTISNNTMMGNVYTGICNLNSSPTIINNIITNNGGILITLPGGILNFPNSSPVIAGNTIANNIGDGIMNLDNSNPAIYNNIISGNTANGIYNDYDPLMPGGTGSSPTITNNTIVGNFMDGICSWNGSNPTITNNIVSSNTSYGIYDDGTGTPINTYNDVWGNGTNYVNITPGVGSISKDPKLDATYHLSSSSPCIDAGTDAGVYTDMDGDIRPMGLGFDIGADEYVPQVFANPIAAFWPVAHHHLRQVNTCLGCIEENLPEDVPEDVQALLDEMQEHIDNANTTGNSIYANYELLKALKCCEDIQEKLGITCPL